ncbi:MAG TPA: substrate-binding domain-containing protein [Ilumatobacteraceae bacterium]|nr:substrate-binding domain-containing protein [Ilumatobacteraceae bacterium]
MKLRTTTAVVAALVLTIAACGDDDDDGDGATTDAPAGTDAPAETDAPAGTEAPGATDAPAGSEAPAGTGGGEGGDFSSILLPKCTGIAVFDQANEGAIEAAEELGVAEPEFVGPATCTDSTGQIEFVTNGVTQGVDAIMVSNNAGDQLDPATQAAADAGVTIVSWDSPIPSGAGESLFVAQVDFDETGQVMADMATSILGEEGGEIAILSASPDAANQNAWIASFEEVLAEPDYASIELVDTVYGNDDADESYNQALALVDSNPDIELIMAPTTVGIAAAAKAMQDEGLCETVKVSGLGLPDEMRSYTENGCAPQFALWSFVDLGYVTLHAAYGLATGAFEAEEGATFSAGRMGDYTIEADPTRDDGLRIVMGPFTVYDESNVGG